MTGLAIVVLAGGHGKRIGGQKASSVLSGHSLLARSLTLARQWSDLVAVSVRHGTAIPHGIQAQLLFDAEDEIGPLAGLLSAFTFARKCSARRVLVLPCDMPFLPQDLAVRLIAGLNGAEASFARCGDDDHPLCSAWTIECSPMLDLYLAEGKRSVVALVRRVKAQAIVWPGADAHKFMNINNMNDLEQAGRMIDETGGP